jgi:hypothetical protein
MLLEISLATNDIARAVDIAERHGGNAYVDDRDRDDLPFRALATVVTDDLSEIAPHADVGLYVTCQRIIKPGRANVYGLFGLVHHPDLTHTEADTHWRDVHAPLALEHHGFMSHYVQLSVVNVINGLALDGIALCGFDSVEDLRERFYTTPVSRDVIARDIATFADTRTSPRRLIARPSVRRADPRGP